MCLTLPETSTCVHAKSLLSCPTLRTYSLCSPPGSSVHGVLQARILEWVAVPFPRAAVIINTYSLQWGFPGGSDGKESACNAEDPDSVPGWGRSSGVGNGNPLQGCCLENPRDRGAWWATVHGVIELDMPERLMRTHTHKRQYFYLHKINQGKIEQPVFCQLFLH